MGSSKCGVVRRCACGRQRGLWPAEHRIHHKPSRRKWLPLISVQYGKLSSKLKVWIEMDAVACCLALPLGTLILWLELPPTAHPELENLTIAARSKSVIDRWATSPGLHPWPVLPNILGLDLPRPRLGTFFNLGTAISFWLRHASSSGSQLCRPLHGRPTPISPALLPQSPSKTRLGPPSSHWRTHRPNLGYATVELRVPSTCIPPRAANGCHVAVAFTSCLHACSRRWIDLDQ